MRGPDDDEDDDDSGNISGYGASMDESRDHDKEIAKQAEADE